MFFYNGGIFLWITLLVHTLGDIRLALNIKKIKSYHDTSDDSRSTSDDDDGGHLNSDGKIRTSLAMTTLLDQYKSNVVCSPVSIILPIAELAIGAKHNTDTLKELQKAVGMKKHDIRKEISNFIRPLNEISSVTLNLESKIYVSDKYTLKSKFKHDALENFDSHVQSLNFKHKEDAVNKINNWVKKKTNGMIKKIISTSNIDDKSVLVLLCALYFKGHWEKSFKSESSDTFYSPSGLIDVPMMTKTEHVRYGENKKLHAKLLEMPYKGNEAQFLIVLPKEKKGLKDLLQRLKKDASLLNSAYKDMSSTSLDIHIPKFKIETELNLKPLLIKLGLKNIFEGDGLTDMINDKVAFVTSAIQKSVIEITEHGTLASSATAINVGIKSIRPSSKKKFVANHPFLFYIIAKGEQVFAGIFNGKKYRMRSVRNDEARDDDSNNDEINNDNADDRNNDDHNIDNRNNDEDNDDDRDNNDSNYDDHNDGINDDKSDGT